MGADSGALSGGERFPDSRPGRKPIPTRRVLEAVLWILNTGAQWHMLPQGYPNYKTVHRRFQQWCREEVLRKYSRILRMRCARKARSMSRNASSMPRSHPRRAVAKEIGPTRRGKGVKIMAIVDRHGLPLSVSTYAANHHEVTLVQLSFEFYMIEAKPENLIGDRAYDSDPLDEQLRREGVEMIARIAPIANARPKTGVGCVATNGAGSSSDSLPGYNGVAGYWFVGSITRSTSSASSSSRPFASSSGNFEILR